jgi:hypothetical protein
MGYMDEDLMSQIRNPKNYLNTLYHKIQKEKLLNHKAV